MLSQQNIKANKFSQFKKFIPWLVALLFFISSQVLLNVIVQSKEDGVRIKSDNEAFNYGINLIADFNRELNALIYLSNGLTGYLKVNAEKLDSVEVNKILKETVIISPIIRNIGVAVGTKLKFIQPLENNKPALGMDYKNFPEQWLNVEKAIETGSGTLSLPIDLVQGGKALIYRKPIYVDGKYWGLLSTVLDLEPLFKNAFGSHNNSKYNFAIREKKTQKIIYGLEDIFKESDLIRLDFNLPNAEWEYAIEIKARKSEALFLFYLRWIGVVVSILASAFIVYFLILRNRDKESQLRLKQNEALFNAIVNTTHAGVSILNRSGEHLFTNNTSEKIHGYSKSEVIGSNIQHVLLEVDIPIVLKTFADILDDKIEALDLTLRLKHKVSHETVWIHAVITKFPKLTVRSEDLVLVSFQNITEQKQLLNELSNLNETKDKFFSIIAHDLRSPFAGILGFLELLTQEDVADFSNKEIQVIMKNMLDTTKLTFDLLENLLTWARSQSEALNFEPEYFDIQPLVFKIVELLRPNAKQKQINVFIKDVESVQVFADSYMVETIVRNLLSNAIKFTPEKGTISFKTEIDSNTEEVIISVKDTGVGISESVMEKIFSLDRNITTLGTNKEKGTGLGLHLCKEFVEKNGGNIFVESNVEQGTVISFTLPLATKKMRFNFSN